MIGSRTPRPAPPAWLLAGLVLLVLVGPARAAGPRIVDGSGNPILWDTATPVLYFVDLGELGTLSNSAARGIVAEGFAAWASVEEAAIRFQYAGPLDDDITGDNYRSAAYPAVGSGINPIVFDDDGSILRDEFGQGAEDDILGLTSYDLHTTGNLLEVSVILNGRCFDGDAGPGSPCELDYDELRGVVLHELGHFAGLDHTDLGREFARDGRASNNAALPTMYPIQSEDDSTLISLNLDDRLSLARLYPAPGFPPSDSVIQGEVHDLAADPFDGANVVVRNLEDPHLLAAAAVSGDMSPDGISPPDGSFRFEGLPPGNYMLELRPVASIFTGASSVGRLNRDPLLAPWELGAPAEYLSLVESSDCTGDLPADFSVLKIGTGAPILGIEVDLNAMATLVNGLSGAGNGDFASATRVADRGDVLGDRIDFADVDYYRIHVPGGWTLRADVDAVDGGLESTLDPRVRLLDPDEAILYDAGLGIMEPGVSEIADPATGLTNSVDPAIDYLAPFSGDLVVAVASSDDGGFTGSPGGAGPYYLRLTPRAPFGEREGRSVSGGGRSWDGEGIVLFGSMPTAAGASAVGGGGTIVASSFVPPLLSGDADGDGVPDPLDRCPGTTDDDADGVCDDVDNCTVSNPSQRDGDADGLGDRCDPPSVVSVLPEDQAHQVHRSATVTVTFSEPMDSISLVEPNALRLVDTVGPVPTDLSVSGDERAVTLDPQSELAGTTSYEVEISGAVEDDDAQLMGALHVTTFTTRSGSTDTIGTNEIGSGYEGSSQSSAGSADQYGKSVAARGDANGDGIKDVLVGGPGADGQKGKVRILFGEAGAVQNGPSTSLELVGPLAGERAGASISFVPDLSGDGIDEILIGAPGANPESDPSGPPGAAYLVFGQSDLHQITGPVDLSTIDDLSCNPCGVILVGAAPDDLAGRAVSCGGDFNNDDLPDLLVGAPEADPLSRAEAGIVYVVYGGTALQTKGLRLLSEVGTIALPGVQFHGEFAGDRAGRALSDWADLASDGTDDILIGAPYADVRQPDDLDTMVDAGVAYAVMGTGAYPGTVDLRDAAYDGTSLPSIVFVGTAAGARAGFAVWGRGDVTGDGENDILIGAPGTTYMGMIEAGAAFIVPSLKDAQGRPPVKGRDASTVDLSPDPEDPAAGSPIIRQSGGDENVSADLDGGMGGGQSAGSLAGFSVGSSGDLNGDGIDEALVGAPGYDASDAVTDAIFDDAGRVYLLFGQRSRRADDFALGNVGTSEPGLIVEGTVTGRRLGEAVTGTGDVDDSGTAELVLGAPGDEATPPDGGQVYITFPVISQPTRDLRVEKRPATTLEWAPTAGAVDYVVYRGDLAELRGDGEVRTAGTCAIVPGEAEVGDGDGDGRPDFVDAYSPGAGSGSWHLVAGKNAYGTGPIGAASAGAPRVNDEISCP